MKSNLVRLSTKEFEVEINGKKLYQIGGAYYCAKCCYRMIPQIVETKTGLIGKKEVYLDMACSCDSHK